MNRRWSAVLSSLIAVAAVTVGASIVGGEARAGSSDEYVAPATLECVDPFIVSTTGPTDAESMGGLRFGYGQDMVLSHTMAVDLPAGTYDVEASTHDSYSFRADVAPQANEQVRIVATAGGDELAATAYTSDLIDGSFTGWAVDDLGTITIEAAADSITIEHYALDHATVGPDSLKVAALCFRLIESADEGDEAADDETADDGETPCPADDSAADDGATDEGAADEGVEEDTAAEECEESTTGEEVVDPCVATDGDATTDDAADDSAEDAVEEDEAAEECEEPTTGEEVADPCVATDGDEAADDAAAGDAAAEECDADVPAEEEPADEVDGECIVVDEGDDTDFSDVADCDDVITIEPCDEQASDGDASGDAADDPEHCEEAIEEEAAEDGDEDDEGPATDDGESDVEAGEGDSDDSTADDSTADDSTDDSTTDDSTTDTSTPDEGSTTGDAEQPPAGPTTPTTAQESDAGDPGTADDPEIPLVDTVPADDEADPVQGAVNQQTPGQQGDLPITGTASGILVMLGLSLAIAGFALIGMVGRQYLGSTD